MSTISIFILQLSTIVLYLLVSTCVHVHSTNTQVPLIFTTYMCTYYQGRIPNEDQKLCKNMVVYLKIYKCYNAALNKHHKKMSSTIKFNPIIYVCISSNTLLADIAECYCYTRLPLQQKVHQVYLLVKSQCSLCFKDGAFNPSLL